MSFILWSDYLSLFFEAATYLSFSSLTPSGFRYRSWQALAALGKIPIGARIPGINWIKVDRIKHNVISRSADEGKPCVRYWGAFAGIVYIFNRFDL